MLSQAEELLLLPPRYTSVVHPNMTSAFYICLLCTSIKPHPPCHPLFFWVFSVVSHLVWNMWLMGTRKANLCFLQSATGIFCLFSTLKGQDVSYYYHWSFRADWLERETAPKHWQTDEWKCWACVTMNSEGRGQWCSLTLFKPRDFSFSGANTPTCRPWNGLSIQARKFGVWY